jgi:hypothetical protein
MRLRRFSLSTGIRGDWLDVLSDAAKQKIAKKPRAMARKLLENGRRLPHR